MSEPGWVAVGRLRRTRGNRGELTGEIYSSQPGRAQKLKNVMLRTEARRRLAEVERVWSHAGRPVFKFVGIDSISDAEAWQGADLLIAEAEQVMPAEGEYPEAGLIGCRVIQAGAGGSVGVVRGVEDYGGAPLLRVEAAGGREILIPLARSICLEIDVAGKVIRVELPEGLTELP